MEEFQVPKIDNEYEKGFNAGYAKGILDNKDYFSGVQAGEKVRTHKIIEFLKIENNGEKFQQDYVLGSCINKLCDMYCFPEMKYSDEELEDMSGTEYAYNYFLIGSI